MMMLVNAFLKNGEHLLPFLVLVLGHARAALYPLANQMGIELHNPFTASESLLLVGLVRHLI